MMKKGKFFRCMLALGAALALWGVPQAISAPAAEAALLETAAQEAEKGAEAWYWLTSDSKYSKYIDPSSVTSVRSSRGKDGTLVATEIQGWIKTSYAYEGALETIQSYAIGEVLAPENLSYSLALVSINPQNRTIQYLKEDFFNANNEIVWSTTDGRVKEINSQEFDEDYYTAIVDAVFRVGEMKRAAADDRWITLYEDKSGDVTTSVTADTTTMRLKGQNLIYWEWSETKDSAGKTVEIKFIKKSVNVAQGTERIVRASYWSAKTGWQEMEDSYEGAYRTIKESEPAYKGLKRIQAYAKGYSMWVNRYSLG